MLLQSKRLAIKKIIEELPNITRELQPGTYFSGLPEGSWEFLTSHISTILENGIWIFTSKKKKEEMTLAIITLILEYPDVIIVRNNNEKQHLYKNILLIISNAI